MNEQLPTGIRGYKATNLDMTCRDFQYDIGKTFKHKGKVSACNSGFHFCGTIFDVFKYYDYNNCRIFEVIGSGAVSIGENKIASSEITFVREIDYKNFITIDHNDNSDPLYKLASCAIDNYFQSYEMYIDYIKHGKTIKQLDEFKKRVEMSLAKRKIDLHLLVKNTKFIQVKREISNNREYAEYFTKETDTVIVNNLIDHGIHDKSYCNYNDYAVRYRLALKGLYLDTLKNDPNEFVRSRVLSSAAHLKLDDIIEDMKDDVKDVRQSLLYTEYCYILVNDKDCDISRRAIENAKYKNIKIDVKQSTKFRNFFWKLFK